MPDSGYSAHPAAWDCRRRAHGAIQAIPLTAPCRRQSTTDWARCRACRDSVPAATISTIDAVADGRRRDRFQLPEATPAQRRGLRERAGKPLVCGDTGLDEPSRCAALARPSAEIPASSTTAT